MPAAFCSPPRASVLGAYLDEQRQRHFPPVDEDTRLTASPRRPFSAGRYWARLVLHPRLAVPTAATTRSHTQPETRCLTLDRRAPRAGRRGHRALHPIRPPSSCSSSASDAASPSSRASHCTVKRPRRTILSPRKVAPSRPQRPPGRYRQHCSSTAPTRSLKNGSGRFSLLPGCQKRLPSLLRLRHLAPEQLMP